MAWLVGVWFSYAAFIRCNIIHIIVSSLPSRSLTTDNSSWIMLPFCKEDLYGGQKAASGAQAGRCFACTCIGARSKVGWSAIQKYFFWQAWSLRLFNHPWHNAAFDPAKLNSVAGAKVNIMRFMGQPWASRASRRASHKTALCWPAGPRPRDTREPNATHNWLKFCSPFSRRLRRGCPKRLA